MPTQPTINPEGNKIIQEENALKVINERGETLKEISLKPEIIVEEEKMLPSEENTKRHKIKKEIAKDAVVSNSGKFAGVISNKTDIAIIDENDKEEIIPEGLVTGKFIFYDNSWNILWEKEFSEGRGIQDIHQVLISDNGESITMLTGSAEYGAEGRETIFVFDKNGHEILLFPAVEEYNKGYEIGAPDLLKISPDGRYLSINIRQALQYAPYRERGITRFYDLKKNTFWDSEKKYVVFEISNEGIAQVDNPWNQEDKTTEINFKEHLQK